MSVNYDQISGSWDLKFLNKSYMFRVATQDKGSICSPFWGKDVDKTIICLAKYFNILKMVKVWPVVFRGSSGARMVVEVLFNSEFYCLSKISEWFSQDSYGSMCFEHYF
uniref:Uncharacterized protein n=1 Tax=Cacopsylla melanoneura TaxID=428564 RepID=A0A8D8UCE6_9HEMI